MKKSIHRIIAFILITAASFAALACLSGCSMFEKKEYALYYDIEKEPKNLDPQVSSDSSSLLILNNIMEGLYRFDDAGQVEFGIAESVEKDGLTYTYKLKEDALWENGESVTANDFVFGFQRLFMPETDSQGAELLYCIENAEEIHNGNIPLSSLGVRAVSDYQLEIKLMQDHENLAYLLTTNYALPCNEKFFYDTKGKYGLESGKLLSNGAFTLSSWKSDGSIKLIKNTKYHDMKSVLPSAVNLYVQDSEQSSKRLKDGKIQASFIQRNDISAFNKKGFSIQVIENATIGMLLNCKNPLLINTKIRQGIAACFDRDSYSDMLGDDMRTAYALIPNSVFLYNEPYSSHRPLKEGEVTSVFSTEKGIALLQEGIRELDGIAFDALRLIINKDDMPWMSSLFSNPSQILQREASVFINVEELDEAQFKQRLSSGDFDLAITTLSSGDHSPNGFFEPFTSDSPNNRSGYSSAELDTLYTNAMGDLQTGVAAEKYWNAEQLLLSDAPFIPMIFITDYFVQSSKVSGIIYNEQTGLISFKHGVYE